MSFRTSGEKDGIIDIEAKSGILYINGSLDWETKQMYKLQVKTQCKIGREKYSHPPPFGKPDIKRNLLKF